MTGAPRSPAPPSSSSRSSSGSAPSAPSAPSSPSALLVDDPRFDRHVPLGHHPERPERLSAARAAIAKSATRFETVTPRGATDDELVRVHSARFIEALSKLRGEEGYLDADTYVSPESVEI